MNRKAERCGTLAVERFLSGSFFVSWVSLKPWASDRMAACVVSCG